MRRDPKGNQLLKRMRYLQGARAKSAPAFVAAMQEEIATLQAENAALQRKLVSARLANRPATDLSDVDFGAPHLRER
jgi:hypothetical protein